MEIAVELEDVTKIYHTGYVKVNALEGASANFYQNEIVAILGPSGSGKTTLLNLIGTLDLPSSGNIKVANQDITQMTKAQLTLFRRHHIGFIFQMFNLVPIFSAQENVELPMIFAKVPKSLREQRAVMLLQKVGLEDRMNHTIDRLSGGEQQRVAIARALANDPDLILADEPTGELDETTSSQIIDMLFEVVRSFGKTMITVTHDQLLAKKADQRYTLKNGVLL